MKHKAQIEELEKKLNALLSETVKCHRGHETRRVFWNCPTCTDHHVEENVRLTAKIELLRVEVETALEVYGISEVHFAMKGQCGLEPIESAKTTLAKTK